MSAASPRGPSPSRARVLGHPLDVVTPEAAAERVLALALADEPSLVVTLNPEIVVRAEDDERLRAAIAAASLCVADGVGVLWAARRAGVRLPARVPGVELAADVMRLGGASLRVYFLGGRPGVAARAATAAAERYGVRIAGSRDGYFADDEAAAVAAAVAATEPHLVLAALGERQETFLAERLDAMGAGAAMGVGGTLDVLAGEARRTPAWTRRAGLEWAWRVGLDPKRWHRAPRLARFALLVLRNR